jgi:hypothetical protein
VAQYTQNSVSEEDRKWFPTATSVYLWQFATANKLAFVQAVECRWECSNQIGPFPQALPVKGRDARSLVSVPSGVKERGSSWRRGNSFVIGVMGFDTRPIIRLSHRGESANHSTPCEGPYQKLADIQAVSPFIVTVTQDNLDIDSSHSRAAPQIAQTGGRYVIRRHSLTYGHSVSFSIPGPSLILLCRTWTNMPLSFLLTP